MTSIRSNTCISSSHLEVNSVLLQGTCTLWDGHRWSRALAELPRPHRRHSERVLARRALPRALLSRQVRRDGGERRIPLAAMVRSLQRPSGRVANVGDQSYVRLCHPDGSDAQQRSAAGLHIVYLLWWIGGSKYEGEKQYSHILGRRSPG